MSQENLAPKSSVFNLVSRLQKILLYGVFVIIPWFVIPLPYDSTEKIRALTFIILTSMILLLEVIKWIWDGKVSMVKSAFDKVFLMLFGSFLVSFIFARDTWIAFWGYDGRVGTAMFSMIFLFLFFYLARGILQKKTEIVRAVGFLSIGLFILIVLSLLSVLKVEVFGWIPYISNFFVVGLPLTFSFQEIMLISGISLFLNIFIFVNYILEKKYQAVIFPLIALVVSIVAIPFFSVNQGALIPILLFVVIVLLCLVLLLKFEKNLKAIPGFLFFLSLLGLVFSIGFQYESFRESILGESFKTLNPISLGADISWVVASSSIVADFFRGLIGLGNDSFALAYNAFKPATDATIALGNTSFTAGSSEVFTVLANRGLIGVTVWVILGFVYIKSFIKDITTGKGEKSTLSSILGLTVIFIFLGSLFLPFSFLTYFLLFSLTLLLLVFNNKGENNEEFLLKFWAVNVGAVSKDINKTMESINWFFTVVVTLITAAGLILLALKVTSIAYVVRAEAYNADESAKYQDFEGEISFEVREAFLVRMANYYSKALQYDSSDPFVNRKSALISLEIINLLSEQYEDASDDEKKGLLTQVSVWKNASIDFSREAISTSPLTYANWNTRASVYIGLISVGLSDYGEDALLALQNCVNLNPLDYDSYYKAGQIFMLQEDYTQALASFNRVLNINSQHVPSLTLAANIFIENKDTDNAIAYLEAAKKILELNEQDEGDLYKSIVDSLNKLGADVEKDTEESATEEDSTAEDTDTTEN